MSGFKQNQIGSVVTNKQMIFFFYLGVSAWEMRWIQEANITENTIFFFNCTENIKTLRAFPPVLLLFLYMLVVSIHNVKK